MLEIAESYDAEYKDDYLEAVEWFRLPYWDYFRPRGASVTFPGVVHDGETGFPYDYSVPRVLTDKTLMVFKSPKNIREELEGNPLCQFKFVDSTITKEEWDILNEDV